MCQAALQYVRRGWAVFPCRERDGEPYQDKKSGETRRSKAKQPYVGNGLKDATRDEQRILSWWKRYPEAMIALPQGINGMFVLDFDPRQVEVFDEGSGEVLCDDDGNPKTRLCTLEELKEALEAQMGCALPRSVTSITPSGGVHVYFRQPEGEPIRNRGNLPDHVDVRGLGGYTIVAPSSCIEAADSATGDYRWLRDRGDWRDDNAFADAPAALIDILRAPKARPSTVGSAPRSTPAAGAPARVAVDIDDDIRKYGLTALDGECRAIRRAGSGRRNAQLNESALKVGSLVAAGALDESIARMSIEAAARDNPGRDNDAQLLATINSGWTAGLSSPRDLSEIAAASRSRRERGPSRPSRAPAPPRPRGGDEKEAPFQTGRLEGQSALSEGEAARAKTVAAAWMKRRLEHVERAADPLKKLAWSIGRRVAGGFIEMSVAKEALWDVYEGVADVQHADIDQALEDGFNRGFDPAPMRLVEKCLSYAMTDFGIAERFRDRYGEDYRFTTAKGWLGWDKRRWKVLDQDEKTIPAEVVAAVFETVRAIQAEARHMQDSGIRRDSGDKELDLEQPHPHGLDRLIPKGKDKFVTLSSIVASWGRASETAGKPIAIANLARRWLTVPIELFDHDKYAVNVMNGTLRFRTEDRPDGTKAASVELSDHRREDMQTKLSPVVYDPDAKATLYDTMFEWAQPDEAMRRYLHQVGGYALTGDAGEQKLWFWYGKGRNGKGVTIESWCHVAGDYSGSIPIGSFLDQGIKKRGDQASPDLAKLGGVRMLRSSEPGRNGQLDSALIKLVTGGEPIPVRMLHRGFFDLEPLFKLIISGNTKFDIPDTDDGIWGRLKLIPWLRHIEKPEPGVANWPVKDLKLVDKIKAKEGSGVLNRLVAGLLDYMANGLAEPSSVTAATSAYRDASDPLARFLRFCTDDSDPTARVQSSKLYDVFVAWCKAAGEREWKQKGFSLAMVEKGIQKKASDGMWWIGLTLVKAVHDFVDSEGRVVALDDDGPLDAARTAARPPDPDDEIPL
jgi:putative DNA primase/helicase